MRLFSSSFAHYCLCFSEQGLWGSYFFIKKVSEQKATTNSVVINNIYYLLLRSRILLIIRCLTSSSATKVHVYATKVHEDQKASKFAPIPHFRCLNHSSSTFFCNKSPLNCNESPCIRNKSPRNDKVTATKVHEDQKASKFALIPHFRCLSYSSITLNCNESPPNNRVTATKVHEDQKSQKFTSIPRLKYLKNSFVALFCSESPCICNKSPRNDKVTATKVHQIKKHIYQKNVLLLTQDTDDLHYAV